MMRKDWKGKLLIRPHCRVFKWYGVIIVSRATLYNIASIGTCRASDKNIIISHVESWQFGAGKAVHRGGKNGNIH